MQALNSLDNPNLAGELQSIGNVIAEKYREHISAFVEDFIFSNPNDLHAPNESAMSKLLRSTSGGVFETYQRQESRKIRRLPSRPIARDRSVPIDIQAA